MDQLQVQPQAKAMKRVAPLILAFSMTLFSPKAIPNEGAPEDIGLKCLGIGFLAKEAGELRDEGVSRRSAEGALARSLTKGDSTKVPNVRLATLFPAQLAFDNPELKPLTLLALGTKLCTIGTKIRLSDPTIKLISDFALVCQKKSDDPALVGACMNQLDAAVEESLQQRAERPQEG
jgi:hypothetical protein